MTEIQKKVMKDLKLSNLIRNDSVFIGEWEHYKKYVIDWDLWALVNIDTEEYGIFENIHETVYWYDNWDTDYETLRGATIGE